MQSIDLASSRSLGSLGSISSHNSIDNDALSIDDLISEPGPDYIKNNLKSYNRRLIAYLTQQGLNVNPLKLKENKLGTSRSLIKFATRSSSRNVDVFITSNGQILFLPFNPYRRKRRQRRSRDSVDGEGDGDNSNVYPDNYAGDEDEEGDDGAVDDDDDDDDDAENGDNQGNEYDPRSFGADISRATTTTTTATELMRGHHHHNVTCHTFCVIVKLVKEETMNPIVRADYHTDAKTRWLQGIPVPGNGVKKPQFREQYRVSKDLDWNLDLRNPDCFIPFRAYDEDDISFDFNTDSESSTMTSTLKDAVFSESPTQEIRVYDLLDPAEYADELEGPDKDRDTSRSLFDGIEPVQAKTFQPGYYVFMLPIAYPVNTPETVLTPMGSVVHRFDVQLDKQPYQPSLQMPPMALSSPIHHSKFEESALDPLHRPPQEQQQQQPPSRRGSHSLIKSSLLKKLGLHRQSSARSSQSSTSGGFLNSLKSKGLGAAGSILSYTYSLPVVRLPPSDATSTLNKSIYVNKVWNDALNYELLLPRKYIQLSPMYTVSDQFLRPHSFLLQMKLIPMMKGLCLKRIKINIIERATYISRDTKYEEDVGGLDRSGVKERVITLLEINARDRPSRSEYPPLCSQVVKGCVDDNLLTCCYKSTGFDEAPDDSHPDISKSPRVSYRDKNDVIITNPVKIQCPLTFTANDEFHFVKAVHKNLTKGATDLSELRDSGDDLGNDSNDVLSIFSVNSGNATSKGEGSDAATPEPEGIAPDDVTSWVSKSPTLTSMLSSARVHHNFYTTAANAESVASMSDEDKIRLYTFFPDTTFHNVRIRHRLQVCFRISKPDPFVITPDGPKMHHYEVIVDTPIVFVSPFCVSETTELPSYEYAVKSSTFDAPAAKQGFSFTQMDSTDSSSMEPQLPTFEEAVLQPGSPMNGMGFGVPTSYSNIEGETVDSTMVVSQSPFSALSISPLSRAEESPYLNSSSVVAQPYGSSVTAGLTSDDLFAKRVVSHHSVVGNSQLSAAAHRQSVSNHPYLSIDSALGSGSNSPHNPSRSSLVFDGEELPSYQSVIEQEMSNGLEQEMSLLSVSDDEESGTYNGNQSDDENDGNNGSSSTVDELERAHANHIV
ncbi:DEKNAAC101796 [Brettanomyces naardenensis]|uniref:DEKNAAC101796 n=1 Tax=Brettanomyces naardenensis TaxID=13370 RepID=A0A448YJ47_BRENA|nr:DEKNAAC101796 [Brettanomyces naardenensis]